MIDPSTGGIARNAEPLLTTPGFDFRGGLVLDRAGSSRPWIKSAEMAATDFVRITTRDGLSMPVYVTLSLIHI